MAYVKGMRIMGDPNQFFKNMVGEQRFNVGDIVVTKDYTSSLSGHFEPGTKVKITYVDEIRGYDLEDEEGNQLLETGFNSVCTEEEYEKMQEGREIE